MWELLSVGLVIVANFLVAFMVLQKNPRSATHWLIALLALVLTGWTIANHFALAPNLEANRLVWVRIVMIITSAFGPIVFLLSTVFPGKKYTPSWPLTVGVVAMAAVTAAVSATPLVFMKVVNFSDGNFTLIPGIGIVVFAITFLGFTTWGLMRFVRKMLASQGTLRKQFRVVIVGMLVSFTLIILTNFLAVVLFQSVQLTFLGPPLTLIMVGSMAYAVIKHRFLDIRSAIARSLSFSLLVGLIALLYSLVLFALTRFLLNEEISTRATLISALIVLPILFSYERLKKTIQKLTEKLFFQYEYDLEPVVQELAQVMTSTLDLRALLQQVISILQSRVKIAEIEVGVIDEQAFRMYTIGHVAVLTDHSSALLKLSQYASQTEENMVVFDELEETPLKQNMRDLGIEVVLALETKNELLGSVFLGAKNSGESYSPQDIRLLRIVAPQLSVAIQNAQSFEQITNFNVTLKKEVEDATTELQAANTRLQELDKLKDQFVSLASHELRTPLTAIKSYLWMALTGQGGEITDKQRYYLERSANSAERLIKLVNDMLNISRIEAGRIGLEIVEVNMEQLCQEVLDEVKPRGAELGLQLTCDCRNPDPQTGSFNVAADPDKIKEVMINLIGNSLKFTPRGGSIVVTMEHKDGLVVTHITDTGAGISPENMKNLFQKFDLMKDSYQTNQDITQGTGLGLFICKSIIELHHGTIKATSEGKNLGAQFSFSLLPYTSENVALLQKENQDIPDKAEIIHNSL